MYFPCFDDDPTEVLTASFLAVKRPNELQCSNLLKYEYTLSQKALWPSSFEKQNVKLVLQLINETVSISLLSVGEKYNIVNNIEISKYIHIFHT